MAINRRKNQQGSTGESEQASPSTTTQATQPAQPAQTNETTAQTPQAQVPQVQAQAQAQAPTPAIATGGVSPAAYSLPGNLVGLQNQAAQAMERSRLSHVDTSQQQAMLDQLRNAELERYNAQIDRGVTQGVNELSRAREDALEGYQTQQNQIDRDEARAKDNQALYAAVRGDHGGIGSAQYNSIMNTAMQNRQTVNNARTKMATDTYRQIAELRANGEFQKADAALNLTQQYLQQLMQIEQWAMEANLSVDQANAQLDQWVRNYNLQLEELGLSQYQWQQSFAYQRERDLADEAYRERTFDYQRERDAANDAYRDKAFDYQRGRDTVADNQWQMAYEANRRDAAWEQAYQTRRDTINDKYRDKTFQYQKERDAISDSQWQQSFDANRADVAWNQNFQTRQADRAQNQWEQEFAANRADTAWNQNFQTQQSNRAQSQWEQEFAANRADTAWNQGFQTQQANRAQSQWEQEFAANRADTAWNQNFQTRQADRAQNQWEQEFAANRADTAWNQGFQQNQFNRSVYESDRNYDRSVYENDRNYDFTQRQYSDTLRQREFENSVTKQQLQTQERQRLVNEAWTYINNGVVPSSEYLSALGMTRQEASERASLARAKEALGIESAQLGNESTRLSNEANRIGIQTAQTQLDALRDGGSSGMSYEDAVKEANAGRWSDAIVDGLKNRMSLSDIVRTFGQDGEDYDAGAFNGYIQSRIGDGSGMPSTVYERGKNEIVYRLSRSGKSDAEKVQSVQELVKNELWSRLDYSQRLDLIQFLSERGIDMNI